MKKVLFICKYNFVRSRKGEKFFSKLVEEKKKKRKVDSFGLSIFAWLFGKRLRKKDLKGVDLVFVMEPWMEKKIKSYGYKGKIIDLKIPNDYGHFKLFGFKPISEYCQLLAKKNLGKYL